MLKNKTFMAFIPARGGSKGLPGKNLRELGGKPLIAWSIEAAQKSKYIDRIVFSTEDDAIAETARQWGAEVPFKRPLELATDGVGMMEVIFHAMRFMEDAGKKCDYLVLLHPTSPFRYACHIDESIELLFQKKADVILGVIETEHSPQLAGILAKDGRMGERFYDGRLQYANRQDLPVYYRLNGAIYVIGWDFLKKERKWLSEGTYAYIMDRRHSLDINYIEDFLLAETLLENSLVKEGQKCN